MNDQAAMGNVELFPGFGDTAEFALNEPADSQSLVAQIDLQEIVDLPYFGPPVNQNLILSDSLDQLFGDIGLIDDFTEELIKRIGNQILVHGRTEVRKVNDFLKVDLGDEGLDYRSSKQQPYPQSRGRAIAHCRLVVHEADPRSIRSVNIYKEEKTPASVETPSLNPVS